MVAHGQWTEAPLVLLVLPQTGSSLSDPCSSTFSQCHFSFSLYQSLAFSTRWLGVSSRICLCWAQESGLSLHPGQGIAFSWEPPRVLSVLSWYCLSSPDSTSHLVLLAWSFLRTCHLVSDTRTLPWPLLLVFSTFPWTSSPLSTKSSSCQSVFPVFAHVQNPDFIVPVHFPGHESHLLWKWITDDLRTLV